MSKLLNLSAMLKRYFQMPVSCLYLLRVNLMHRFLADSQLQQSIVDASTLLTATRLYPLLSGVTQPPCRKILCITLMCSGIHLGNAVPEKDGNELELLACGSPRHSLRKTSPRSRRFSFHMLLHTQFGLLRRDVTSTRSYSPSICQSHLVTKLGQLNCRGIPACWSVSNWFWSGG